MWNLEAEREQLPYRARMIAMGEVSSPYEFSPKDWRPLAIALLLYELADEIDRLRAIAGAARSGPTFADITKDISRNEPPQAA